MGTKFLVAVSSCDKFERNGWNDVPRKTWLQGVDYKFFHGIGAEPKEDVVVLPVKDDYLSLIEKTRQKFKWCKENGYAYIFHCYHDTYAVPERLEASGFDTVDYMGDFYHKGAVSYGDHCQGGQGYFASRKVLELMQSEPLLPEPWETYHEDVWVGKAVVRNLATLKMRDSRDMVCLFNPRDVGPRKGNSIMSCHLSAIRQDGYDGKYEGREAEFNYKPEHMLRVHKEWLESCR